MKSMSVVLLVFLLYAGGRPSKGTRADKRKSHNNPTLTRNRPKGAGKGRTIHRKGGK